MLNKVNSKDTEEIFENKLYSRDIIIIIIIKLYIYSQEQVLVQRTKVQTEGKHLQRSKQ